jgi:predicted AAA+ superfamily ATPase
MLKRKAYNKIKFWKDHKRKQGLLINGARQVGKTYLIQEFAKNNYDDYIEINLFNDIEAQAVFSEARNAKDLMMRITLYTEKELIPGKTLIFIDEVQECKEIVTAIKFLVDENDYDFILSGSLLGVELEDIRSVPVGYLDTITMYPLDFEEFLLAKGIQPMIIDSIRDSFQQRIEVKDFIHNRIMDIFYEYLIIGGMPDAVQVFIEKNNLALVRETQANLILQNKKDISKYNKAASLNIKQIYDIIPRELNNQNKRFILKDMNEKAKFNQYANSFSWLEKAGVALPTYCVDEPKYPLLLSSATNLFKLFLSDVGMLTSTFMKSTTASILAKNKDINYGSIYENVVAQELVAKKFELYYYKNKKFGELDFVIETMGGNIYPIVVKSGKAYKRHNAMTNVLANYKIKEGFVLSDNNLSVKDNFTYLPIYMTMFFDLLD